MLGCTIGTNSLLTTGLLVLSLKPTGVLSSAEAGAGRVGCFSKLPIGCAPDPKEIALEMGWKPQTVSSGCRHSETLHPWRRTQERGTAATIHAVVLLIAVFFMA